MYLHNSLIYFASNLDSFQVIYNISNPFDPEFETSFSYESPYYPGSHQFRNLFVYNDTLLIFLGDFPPYTIFNISEPTEPVFITEHMFDEESPIWQRSGVGQYHVMDHYLVLTGVRGFSNGFWSVLDIEDPLNPEVVIYNPCEKMIYNTMMSGTIISIWGETPIPYSQISIYDFTNPYDPILLDVYPDYPLEHDDFDYIMFDFYSSSLNEGYFWGTTGYAIIDSIFVQYDYALYNIQSIIHKNYTFNLIAGWNLISYPLYESLDLDSIFPFTTYSRYNSTERAYEDIENAKPGEAFWILAEYDTIISYTEYPNSYLVKRTLYPGWNLAGPTLRDLPANRILRNPSVIPPIYEYNSELGEYFATDTLRTTNGYWILSSDTTEITTWKEYHDKYYR